jgi:hypothetical protein
MSRDFRPDCRAMLVPLVLAAARADTKHAICLYHAEPTYATFNDELTVDGLADEISTLNLAGGVRADGRRIVHLDRG